MLCSVDTFVTKAAHSETSGVDENSDPNSLAKPGSGGGNSGSGTINSGPGLKQAGAPVVGGTWDLCIVTPSTLELKATLVMRKKNVHHPCWVYYVVI